MDRGDSLQCSINRFTNFHCNVEICTGSLAGLDDSAHPSACLYTPANIAQTVIIRVG